MVWSFLKLSGRLLFINLSTYCLPPNKNSPPTLNLRTCYWLIPAPLPHLHLLAQMKHHSNNFKTPNSAPPNLAYLLIVVLLLSCLVLSTPPPFLSWLLCCVVLIFFYFFPLLLAALHLRLAGTQPKALPQASAEHSQCKAIGKHGGRTDRIASRYYARTDHRHQIVPLPQHSRALVASASPHKCCEGLRQVRTSPACLPGSKESRTPTPYNFI